MALITISRGTFGGGKDVAEKLAEHLQYNCISREMVIHDASKMFDIPEEQLLNATSELPDPLGLRSSANMYDVKYIRAAILERAVGNRMVYHGHGGHLLMAGIPGLLRVRINAGMEYRINHAMNDKKIPRHEAIDLIKAIDKKRKLWSMKIWGIEWNDPSLYDLVISLDNVSTQSAVKIIVSAKETDEFVENRYQQTVFENELIKSRIWAALTKNKYTRQVRIHLDSEDGIITIKGDVGSNKLADAIVAISREVNGVTEVINDLSVGSSWHW